MKSILLFLALGLTSLNAADFITRIGTYESAQKKIKLEILAKPGMKLYFRVHFTELKGGGSSDTGPSQSVSVAGGRWGFYIENEDRVWFYDGLTQIVSYESNSSGPGRKMPPEVARWYNDKIGK